MQSFRQLFYSLPPQQEVQPQPEPEGYAFELWRPAASRLWPDGTAPLPFAVWSTAHHLGVFANRDHAVFLARDGGRAPVHRSIVFPRWLRFPFMGPDDLQVGDIWTDPAHRGRGLTPYALHAVVRALRRPRRTFWYVVAEDNAASIRSVEKAGFALRGRGVRSTRLGLRLLGTFDITEPAGGGGLPA